MSGYDLWLPNEITNVYYAPLVILHYIKNCNWKNINKVNKNWITCK